MVVVVVAVGASDEFIRSQYGEMLPFWYFVKLNGSSIVIIVQDMTFAFITMRWCVCKNNVLKCSYKSKLY